MVKSTDTLLSELNNIKSLNEYYQNNKSELLVPDALEKLLQKIADNGVSRSELIRDSGIDRTYAYHLLAGEKKLTRDKLLLFALAGKLNLEQIQVILKYAGVRELYARDKRDAVIIFAFNRHMKVYEADELLASFELKTLNL